MAGSRNTHGVNFATDCYRTFAGELYPAWTSFPSEERITAYRAAGLRCRRIGQELFLHHADQDEAREIDQRQEFRS